MANNYTTFSTMLENLTPEEVEWIEYSLEVVFLLGNDEYTEDEVDDEELENDWDYAGPRIFMHRDDVWGPDDDFDTLGFQWTIERGPASTYLWLYAEESGDPYHAAVFIQEYLRRWHPDKCKRLSWAYTCSKPRANAFGGDEYFITATELLCASGLLHAEITKHYKNVACL